jgi:catechol 2,3-dioxygenase-like lactoylglutathione lyase family enzyme
MLADRRVHTTLPTHDVDALRAFYEGVLGFEPMALRPGAAAYRAGDGSLFVISRSGGQATGAHTQMAFTVPDVAAEVRELQARGVVFESYEMPKTENGVAQMRAGRGAWFKDPDGNLLGLFEFAEPI